MHTLHWPINGEVKDLFGCAMDSGYWSHVRTENTWEWRGHSERGEQWERKHIFSRGWCRVSQTYSKGIFLLLEIPTAEHHVIVESQRWRRKEGTFKLAPTFSVNRGGTRFRWSLRFFFDLGGPGEPTGKWTLVLQKLRMMMCVYVWVYVSVWTTAY